jgi:hypothetical protein
MIGCGQAPTEVAGFARHRALPIATGESYTPGIFFPGDNSEVL